MSRPADKIKPPFIRVDTCRFQRGFGDFLKQIIERKETDKAERFTRAITRNRLLRGHARWFPYRGNGYVGPVDVDIALSVSPEREYHIAVGFRATGPGARDAKNLERTISYPTKMYQP
jgi:hypothetical protein